MPGFAKEGLYVNPTFASTDGFDDNTSMRFFSLFDVHLRHAWIPDKGVLVLLAIICHLLIRNFYYFPIGTH